MFDLVGAPHYWSIGSALLSCSFCGVWGLLAKIADVDPAIFGADFVIAQNLFGWLLCLLLGEVIPSPGESPLATSSWLTEFQKCELLVGLAISCGGVALSWANMLLISASQLLGCSVAFPTVMGAGLVGGTFFNYLINPSGNVAYVAGGLMFAVMAIVMGALAQLASPYESAPPSPKGSSLFERVKCLRRESSNTSVQSLQTTDSPNSNSIVSLNRSLLSDYEDVLEFWPERIAEPPLLTGSSAPTHEQHSHAAVWPLRGLLLALTSAIFSSLWSPISAYFIVRDNVDVYTGLFWFMLGQAFGQLVSLIWLYRSPWRIVTIYREYDGLQHSLGLAAGGLHMLGLLSNFLAGRAASFTVAFGIFQCSPLVTALVGTFFFRELHGRTVTARRLTILMCGFYLACVGLLILAQS